MQITNSVIQLAKERAQFGFGALMQQVLSEADEPLAQLLVEARSGGSGAEQYAFVNGRQFILNSGKMFVQRVEAQYREWLNRAMQTMYTDLRLSVHELSADNLTLIDDETVNHQLEIDRQVLRLRTSADEHVLRLNLIIAQMHGGKEVRERENPFRPYLMARTLHQVLADMVPDEETRKRLLSVFSDLLGSRLSGFYSSIRDVFETNGVHAELIAMKSRQSGRQADTPGVDLNQRVLPGLQRVMNMMNPAPPKAMPAPPLSTESLAVPLLPESEMQQKKSAPSASYVPGAGASDASGASSASQQSDFPALFPLLGEIAEPPAPASVAKSEADAAAPAPEPQQQEFQDFVNGIFNAADVKSTASTAASTGMTAAGSAQSADKPQSLQAASTSLLARLNQYQHQAALGQSIDGQAEPEQNQLFALSSQLGPDQATKLERVAIDIVAMLFELILNDAQIPESLRGVIGKLQIPFLKAAMLTPDMLQQTQHPARQLVNRLGSATVALDLSTPLGRSVEQETNRIVNRILNEFDDDISIFADSLKQLEHFLSDNLRLANAGTEQGVNALEDVEQKALRQRVQTAGSGVGHATGPVKTPAWLSDFTSDPRVINFVVNVWMKVMAEEAASVGNSDEPRVFRDLLPDLIWSVQDKQSVQERSALLQLLPVLVRRLKVGMSLVLHMSEAEVNKTFDQMVEVHSQILGRVPGGGEQHLFNLDEMRAHFSRVWVGMEERPEPVVEARQMESELAKRGLEIDLDLEREETPSFESDADWLTRVQIGTCVEQWTDTGYQPARLVWVSKRQTLFMFQLEKKTVPLVYSSTSLIKSLREGSVRLVEYAPVFERAVESLLIGVRAVNAQA